MWLGLLFLCATSDVVTVDAILEVALARNPGILEAQARMAASDVRGTMASRLPDIELKYEQWGVPLGAPWALGDANLIMFGVRQMLPALGSREARARAAQKDAARAVANLGSRAQDLTVRVRRAFAEYYQVDREGLIHQEHVTIAEHVVKVARTNYQAGRGTQQDVLRSLVALSSLHNDVVVIEQQRISSVSLLNTLMGRDPDAPLGSPAELAPPRVTLVMADIELALDATRPELLGAKEAVAQEEALREARESEARWPAVMLGADYMLMPMGAVRHGYGAMASMNLPWLNPRHTERVREAEYQVLAQRHALDLSRLQARFELRDAAARYQAAQKSFAIIAHELLPRAQQSYEAAQAGFLTGQTDSLNLLDALRSYHQVRIEEVRARAHLVASFADVERAFGGPLPQGDPHE